MQQQYHQQFFQPQENQRPLRTWGELVQLDQRDQELIECTTFCINQGTESEKQEIIEISTTVHYRDLLAISNHSRIIYNFFKQEKYKHFWQVTLEQIPNGYSNRVDLHPFDRLMGVYIAYEFEAWILADRYQSQQARVLSEAAGSRGINIERLAQDRIRHLMPDVPNDIGLTLMA